MKLKMLGGILLITGTCIGGGMLGLPIATAKGGIIHSSLLFILCWMLMTFAALLTLEVNLCFPKHSNVISMAKATLGKPGAIICWSVYLLFLYALVSAYIAGGQDVLHGLLNVAGINIPIWACGILFVLLFGSIVVAGIKHVDIFNRFLMLIKFGAVFILMYLIASHINLQNYGVGKAKYLLPALTVAITSFGFSIIVPSLRTYFNDDIKKLRIAIIVGSFLPLLCYIAWIAVIFGLIPLNGDFGLARLSNANQPVTGLLESIQHYISTDKIIFLARAFTSICVLTAFACVSLGLSDYLADGFKISHVKLEKFLVTLATFLPPLLMVIFYPKAFILFLSVAGLCCVMLQALMPALMAWNCRYVKNIAMPYQVYGGKISLIFALIASIMIIGISGYQLIF
jgi:tyrosine-specific transport protein